MAERFRLNLNSATPTLIAACGENSVRRWRRAASGSPKEPAQNKLV